MELYQTKHGYQGQVKGCIKGIPFCFYANGDTAKSVHQQLIFEVAKLCAFSGLGVKK